MYKRQEVDDADEQEESAEPEILRDEDFNDDVLEDEEMCIRDSQRLTYHYKTLILSICSTRHPVTGRFWLNS